MPNSNYIVKELQKYKSYWQCILGHKIHLDFINGEVQIVFARYAGSVVVIDKSSFENKELLDRLTIEKKRIMWNKIKQIEWWLSHISEREREAIFWRYIQHDFEPSPYYQQNNLALKWKTLSWEEIAKKMRVSVAAVREYVDRGLSKIQELVEAYTRSD
jgi:hypothetical protein